MLWHVHHPSKTGTNVIKVVQKQIRREQPLRLNGPRDVLTLAFLPLSLGAIKVVRSGSRLPTRQRTGEREALPPHGKNYPEARAQLPSTGGQRSGSCGHLCHVSIPSVLERTQPASSLTPQIVLCLGSTENVTRVQHLGCGQGMVIILVCLPLL